jgi:KipI family sensor histidine kinase inhibitor
MKELYGFYIQFSETLNEVANAELQSLCATLLNNLLTGVTDLYPGYINLYIEYDTKQVKREAVESWVKKHAQNVQSKTSGKQVTIPVRYDGEDLAWVAEQTQLTPVEVIRLHSQKTYHVYAVGFTPGFPLMGKIDDALYLSRRKTPRKKVPAHSVAMAVSQTAVYPLSTPGGWHLLGTALETVYDPHREKPFLLEPGDTVKFEPSNGPTPKDIKALELLPKDSQYPVLRVEEPGLLDVVVDAGRFMAARYGMARTGAIDERSARLANALLGNPAGTALLEMTLKGPVFTVLQDTVLGFTGFGMQPLIDNTAIESFQSFALKKGQRLSFKSVKNGSRGYLALLGGIESEAFMGSCSTDLVGCIGRALHSGDVLGSNSMQKTRPSYGVAYRALPNDIVIRILPGPQASPEALTALTSSEFRVSSQDRMGLRLEGPKVPGGELISEATPMGAVQVTTEGKAIVLLNDRGCIGGYAKPALIDPRDLSVVAQLRPGQKLRFYQPKSIQIASWTIRSDQLLIK